MEKLGFVEKWIDLIMNCVSSVSYSVLINGEACGKKFPFQGALDKGIHSFLASFSFVLRVF